MGCERKGLWRGDVWGIELISREKFGSDERSQTFHYGEVSESESES